MRIRKQVLINMSGYVHTSNLGRFSFQYWRTNTCFFIFFFLPLLHPVKINIWYKDGDDVTVISYMGLSDFLKVSTSGLWCNHEQLHQWIAIHLFLNEHDAFFHIGIIYIWCYDGVHHWIVLLEFGSFFSATYISWFGLQN